MEHMSNVKNYTPHPITLFPASGEAITLRPDGVARVTSDRVQIHELDILGVPVIKQTFGNVTGLPDEEEGTYCIVSRVVALALQGQRNDLLVPADLHRDCEGNILGCAALEKV